MALTSKIINEGFEKVASLNKQNVALSETISNLKNSVSDDINYQKLAEGTDFGNKFNTEFLSIIEELNDFYEAMSKVAQKTDSYLNEQQAINSRD